MPATSTKIFILGATGYIGGAIIKELQRTSAAFTITALVRKDQDIETLEALGVKTIKGSFTDVDKIEEASREADIVYNAADADDMSLNNAVLRGLKSKKDRGVLIQTSGTGLLSDNYNGELTPEGSKVWNVSRFDDIKGIPPTQPHRDVDLEIFGAHERGEIDAYIIAPSCIYGIGDGPVNKLSQQVPRMIRQPVYVGKGTNLWNNVHISDLIQLYTIILNLALSVRAGETPRPEAYTNFYFASVGEHAWGDVAKRIGPILLAKGKVEKAEARSVKASEVENFSALTTNSRSVSVRGRNLGWMPVAKSLEDSLEEDIDAVLATMK
ncbi:NAD(P)H-binding family protein [Ceratobasidium sp. AG-Ba]|nr:NAD(P)H-binding family protein [Ceratobasidium sp. AG-Ba]